MYYIFYFLPVVLYFMFRNNKHKGNPKLKIVVIMTLLLSICSAIRKDFRDSDTYQYKLGYEQIETGQKEFTFQDYTNILSNDSEMERRDPGYDLLCKLCSFVMSFRIFLFFVALLLISAIGYLIFHYVEDLSGYIIAYAYYTSLFYHYLPNSAVRQTIAMGMLLWAYILWYDKTKKLLPILLVLVASTIHKSVLLGLLPFILQYMPKLSQIPKLTVFGWIAMLIAGQSFSVYFASLLGSDTYMDYALSSYYDSASKPYMFIIQIFCIYVISLFSRQNFKDFSKIEKLIFTTFYLGVIASPIILVSPSQIRGAAYYTIFGVAFIPNIVSRVDKTKKSIIYILLIGLILGRPLLLGIEPFYFFWE